jgi:hypothetical protein
MDSRSVPKAIYVNPVLHDVCFPSQKVENFILSTKSFGELTLNKKVWTLLRVVTTFFQRQILLSFQLRYPDGLLWFNAHRPDRGVAASFNSGCSLSPRCARTGYNPLIIMRIYFFWKLTQYYSRSNQIHPINFQAENNLPFYLSYQLI